MKYLSTLLFALLLSTPLQGAVITSDESGNWSDSTTWAGGVVPTSTDDAIIATGTTVTLTANDTITNFTVQDGGVFDYGGFTLTVNGSVSPYISVQTGDWGTAGTWLNGTAPGTTDSVMVSADHTISVAANATINNLQINSGGTVKMNQGKSLVINGDWIHNGTWLVNNTGASKDLTFNGTSISGNGIVDFESNATVKALVIAANTTLESGSNISILGNLNIDAGITFTIDGALLMNGDVTGDNATTSIITMNSGSNMEVSGEMFATGVLNASSGSTVEYTGTAAQTIKDPSAGYGNLVVTNAGTKSLAAALDINGNLSILSGTLDVVSGSNFAITIAGNWSNSGTFLPQNGTVTFDGTSNQTFSNSSGDSLYNMTINKSSGDVVLNNDLLVTNTITFTSGNIDANGNTFTLGTNTPTEGTIAGNGGHVIGKFQYYFTTGSTGITPIRIGTDSDSTKVSIDFSAISTAGALTFEFVESNPGTQGIGAGLVDSTDLTTVYNTYVEGYWSMTNSGIVADSFDIYLEGNSFTSFTIDNDTRVVRRDNSSSDWEFEGNHIINSGDTLKRDSLTTLTSQYAFAINNNCTPPVTSAISGDTEVCTSDSVIYAVTQNTGNTYFWSVTGGTFDSNDSDTVSGLNLDSVAINWSSTGQVGTIEVYENDPACTNSETVSLNVNVNTIAPTSIVGKVVVAENTADVSYAVTDAGYQYEWTITGGDLDLDNNANITVDWGSSGNGQVSVVATDTARSCAAAPSLDVSISIYVVLESDTASGDWSTGSTWASGSVPNTIESVRILAGDSVYLTAATTITNVVIEPTGVLNMNGNVLTVNGDLEVDGRLVDAAGGGSVNLDGGTSTPPYSIDGIGTITADININNGDKVVSSSADLTIEGTMTLADGVDMTNEGSVTIGSGGTLTGPATGSSTWTNSSGGKLVVEGTLTTTNLTLVLSDAGTTSFGGTATIPSSLDYFDLEITGTNSLDGSTTVLNDMSILSSATLTMAANDLSVAGDITFESGSITSTGGILTLNGTTNQQYTSTVGNNLTVPLLEINNTTSSGDAFTLNDTLTVSDTLYLTDGVIGSDTTSLLVLDNCDSTAIVGGSATSFINNALDRCTDSIFWYTYPVGDSITFKQIQIQPQVNGNTNSFVIQAFQEAAANRDTKVVGLFNVSGLEYWNIERDAGSDSIKIRLFWNSKSASDITGNFTDLKVAHYDDNVDNRWEDLGNAGGSDVTNNGYIESSTPISTFSPTTFGSTSGENELPITLMYFEGHSNKDGTVSLHWETATEINNDYFEIRRSIDGKDFEIIGEVKGAGDSNDRIEYSFIDNDPYYGASYYRFRQVDFDGQYDYSPIIRIVHETHHTVDYSLAYNPTTSSNIHLITEGLENNSILEIQVFNALGQKYFEDVMISRGAKLQIIPDNRWMPQGMYFVRVVHADRQKTLRLLIK